MLRYPTQTISARVLPTLGVIVLSSLAAAQHGVTFSTDYKGPSQGAPAQTGPAIRESDILSGPFDGLPGIGQVPPPNNSIPGGALGLSQYFNCGNPTPGVPCKIEVDAISRGKDFKLEPFEDAPGNIFFSVDEYARGMQGAVSPNVFTEAAVDEASADVFSYIGPLPGPIPPIAGGGGNVGEIDGNGHTSQSGFLYPGLGIVEPNPAGQGSTNEGDNLDALDIYGGGTPLPPSPRNPIYFSLDGNLLDPLEGIQGSDSAFANSQLPNVFSAADILTASGSPVPGIYAFAVQLGLDPAGDDVDAVAIWDNGDGEFQPSTYPYEWSGGETDMLIFSVRRGSQIIGQPDSIFNLPIQAGDLLIPPVTHEGHLMMAASTPGIFISSEALGLRTDREESEESDDLDSVDVDEDPFSDCNNNGTADGEDISVGTSDDLDNNGIPDECEDPVSFCEGNGSGTASPCGNDNDGSLGPAGCRNGSSDGGASLRAMGTTSVLSADFQLGAEGLVPSQPGLYFQGVNAVNGGLGNAFGDGLRCVGGGVNRLEVQFANSTGHSSTGGNLISKGSVASGDRMYYQLWYRDPTGTGGSPCGSGFNLTNGLVAYFGP